MIKKLLDVHKGGLLFELCICLVEGRELEDRRIVFH